MWVKFTVNETVEDENGIILETFEAGETYNLGDASGDRWIRRDKAIKVAAPRARPAQSNPKKPDWIHDKKPTPKKKIVRRAAKKA